MKTQNARELAVELFSGVPGLKRVEANIEDDLWERAGVILIFVVDDDYDRAENSIIPLLGQFMTASELAVDFRILRESDYHGRHFPIYDREDTAA
jgi:hypothetical protein